MFNPSNPQPSRALPAPRRSAVRLDTSLELLLGRGAAARGACVLATVVAAAGSTYRKPGARMMIMADGSYLGLLSGGCLEADLALHARQVLADGAPRAIEYDMRGPDDILFGIGAGCEGAMRVLLEPAAAGGPAAAALLAAGEATAGGDAFALVAVHESPDLPLGTYPVGPALPPALAAGAREALAAAASQSIDFGVGPARTRAFVQYLEPVPRLLICGAGPDAQPVAAAALSLGWRVIVVDHRPAYALADRFPGAHVHLSPAAMLRSVQKPEDCHAAVVMSHHLPSDAAYLSVLADAGGPDFVGLLGPAARRQRLLNEIGARTELLRGRLRGPVGLDIGAVTPEGIALSIVAQLHAWLAARRGGDFAIEQ